MKPNRLGGRFWISMLVFGLMGQVAWVVENMYFNVFIYNMFHASASDISTMVMASAVVAALTTLVMGAVSDRIGRRRAFMSVGYMLWGVSILVFAYIRSVTLTIVMDCVMTFFGSTANDAAYNAWLTDRGDSTNRGLIEGINSMMPLVSVLIVFGGFMSFDLGVQSSWTTIYYIIGIATFLIGLAGTFLIQESGNLKKSEGSMFQTLIYSFRPSVIRQNVKLYLVLLLFAVFGTSIQIFMPYIIIYYERTLGISNYVMIMGPSIILASVVTALYGRVYDRKGFLYSMAPVVGMLMVGYVILFFSRSIIPVAIGSLLGFSGYLTGMSVFGAMIRDNIPENKAGQFQGVRIIGQVFIPGLIGPAIGAAVLKDAQQIVNSDGTTSFLPNRSIWAASLIVILVLVLLLYLVSKKLVKRNPRRKEGRSAS
ncbi:MAG: MFS transporter [Spirochaetales bacterium]|nr:MFS transporter [Spirochaetales bacterium]